MGVFCLLPEWDFEVSFEKKLVYPTLSSHHPKYQLIQAPAHGMYREQLFMPT